MSFKDKVKRYHSFIEPYIFYNSIIPRFYKFTIIFSRMLAMYVICGICARANLDI